MRQVDVAVIGGGIHGAGVAQAAAAAGYRVLLVERSHWAAGTSSKSSKLIHGGLRYLESGELSLVYQNLRERKLLLRNAPELVKAVPFHIPIYRQTSRRPWQIRAGLNLYRLLAGFRELSAFERLPRADWQQLDGLDTEGLQTVFRYWDAQTDDRALTAAVVQSAVDLGAETLCPAELVLAEHTEKGYRLRLRCENGELEYACSALVNACGPWVNEVAARIQPAVVQRPISLVRGSHIVVPGNLRQGIYYLESPSDRRAVFAMPWQGNILLGTTEGEHTDSADQVTATEEDIRYLQATYAHYFPGQDNQVITQFAGLRVLPRDDKSAFRRSRETFLLCDNVRHPHMVAIYGGKLTNYRHTAERVVELLERGLGERQRKADTRTLRLTPAASGN